MLPTSSKLMAASRRAITVYAKSGYRDVVIRHTTSGDYRLTLRHHDGRRVLRMFVFLRESRIVIKRRGVVVSDYVVG